MHITRAKLLKFLVAILLGNAVYFILFPYLPLAAQHRSWQVDMGTIVDFWFCLLMYGLMELGAFVSSRRARDGTPKA